MEITFKKDREELQREIVLKSVDLAENKDFEVNLKIIIILINILVYLLVVYDVIYVLKNAQ